MRLAGPSDSERLLETLAAIPDGDEVADMQPRVARVLNEYLRPRGYRAVVKPNDAPFVDIGVYRGADAVAFVEVKRPAAQLDSDALKQLRRYLDEHGCAVGIATNGRKTHALWRGGNTVRLTPMQLEQIFPATDGANMKNLSDAQLKRLVIECLDDSGFFAVLKERIFNSLHDEDARRPSEPDAGKLPSDLKRLEGVELVPRSGKMRAVATVERGRVLLNGRSFPSLSSAAKSVTGSSVNGRIWWRVR